MIHPLWQRYPDVHRQLEATQALLQARTQLRDPQINALVQAQVTAGGKMLRSGLMFMLARLHHVDNRQLIHAAAAIEALHLATLVHDDVLDGAATRRGQATVHPSAGNRSAIYAGDFLFSVYFDLLADAAPDVADVGVNARAMRRIFLGELDQNSAPRGAALTIHQYLRQIAGKTAALFALATYQGMRLADGTEAELVASYRYGRLLGMAFQLQDDLLDFTGDHRLAKPRLEDLENGIYTLPVLYALQAKPALATTFAAAQHDPAAKATAAREIRALGVPQALQLATRYTQKAEAALQAFPASPERADLVHLTHALLNRHQ
ncbi:polyprenyl synthetase family protein [Lacticaseibacillus nasuensis]|nr:polyprenyl synthetase family protein [Lacticaseibacillus nasuensis]